jgi:hypothetical protein
MTNNEPIFYIDPKELPLRRPDIIFATVNNSAIYSCTMPVYAAPPELEKRIEGLETSARFWHDKAKDANDRLAECQAREKLLRDACNNYSTNANSWKVVSEALALPQDSTALDKLLKEAKGVRQND